jgi:HEAT repeat protein
VRVRAAAVDALVGTRSPDAATPLREALKDPAMPAVMQRRHIAGLHTLLTGIGDTDKREFLGRMCARTFGGSDDDAVNARFARLLGSLGRAEHPVGAVNEYVETLVTHGIKHRSSGVRAASVAALARIGLPENYDAIREVAQQDRDERVRFHALRAGVALKAAEAGGLMIDRLRYDEHPMVREEAAAMLGRFRVEEALQSLINTLDDESWEVCVSVAVSLGKLRRPEGVAPLVELLGDKDWRRRGAAVAGLGWIRQTEAIEPMIDALRDREPAVQATAREFLRYVSGETHEIKTKPWREWWDQYRTRFEFLDREREIREAKKYGYAVQPRQVYEDLDVVVLKTRGGGDNIQDLLAEYGIEHRIIRAASVDDAGLHPFALFVANCPGEIVADDVERLQWFVRAGGYLFASCWALTHTVEVSFPDVVRKLETRAQVLDTVEAERCPVDSPFLEGVFEGPTRPLYELVGAHLIDVIDPERFEVLIDSPHCATAWGDGNLAGWFTIGHGVVLDSSNHFDMQGMKQAKVRTEEDRMAFAVDHLGYGWEELRALRAEGVFKKQPEAIKRTRDLTIFRFITTFVRQKRLADGR